MTKTTIVLFTFNLPTDLTSEGTFLRVELEYLERKFDRIILVPQVPDKNSKNLSSFEEDMSLAEMFYTPGSRLVTYISAVTSSIFWRETFINFSLENLKPILWENASGRRICDWFVKFCKHQQVDFSQTVFYTYWLDRVTFGLALAKRKNPSMLLVSRAHRVDLYESQESPRFFPFREFTLGQINDLFLVSKHGLKYISEKYPAYINKYKVAKLGVKTNNVATKPSPQGEIQIVSCSQIRPVKRVGLIAEGIGVFANEHPDIKIFWDHFGGGDPLELDFPVNVAVKFWGKVANDVVLNFYKKNPIDVFINASSSEGIPVSIMEAIAYGIPVVAPAVGGIPEIVSGKNGFLLNSNPSPDEIADAIEQFIPFSENIEQKRNVNRKIWEEYYNADKNFDLFSSELVNLLGSHE